MNQYYIDYIEKELTRRMSANADYSDNAFSELVEACVNELDKRIGLSEKEKKEISDTVFNGRRKLGILQPLLDDPEVNEIMINGTESIYIEKSGKLLKYDKRYTDAGTLYNVIQTMVSWVDRSVNESSPIVDTRLSDGSRVNVVMKPVAINGPIVTIRKFPDKMITWEKMIELGSVTKEEVEFLRKCIRKKVNIFVSGGTSSGKTTLLNMLCGFISEEERIVTVEESAELRLTVPNLVKLETKDSGPSGNHGIGMRSLIKTSLRMRPDRIIVGEVRDSAAVEMLQAMGTGHPGSMSTAHANSAQDIITRLETMSLWEGTINPEAVRKQIASGLDLIVHMRRDSKMRRYIKEICQTIGYIDGEIKLMTIYRDGKRVSEILPRTQLYEKLNEVD